MGARAPLDLGLVSDPLVWALGVLTTGGKQTWDNQRSEQDGCDPGVLQDSEGLGPLLKSKGGITKAPASSGLVDVQQMCVDKLNEWMTMNEHWVFHKIS